jgi:hypothetical protein
LLHKQRPKGLDLYFFLHLSNKKLRFVGYAFLDDSELVQALQISSTPEEIIQAIQQDVNKWEGSLSTTSGSIVPDKTYWYQVDFQ